MAKTVLSEAERKKLEETNAQFRMFQEQAEGFTPSSYIDNRGDLQKQAEGLENKGGRMGADDDGMAYFREAQNNKLNPQPTTVAPEAIDYVGIEKKRLADEAALKETQRRNLLARDAMNQTAGKSLSKSSTKASFEEYTGKTKRKSLLVPLNLFK